MRVIKVEATYKRTFNLGDYNSVAIGVTIGADVETTDISDEVIASLQEEAREAVREEYLRLRSKTKNTSDED